MKILTTTTRKACFLCAFLFIGLTNQVISQTFATAGTYTWTCPYNVYSAQVQIWGGGGSGGDRTGSAGASGGGGGGAFVSGTVTVVPGTVYTVTVGGTSTDSWFINNTTALAKGGNSVAGNTVAGGAGGLASASIIPAGGVKFSGGNGFTSGGTDGGGGGAGAGTSNNGANATSATGAVGTNGGGSGGAGRSGSSGDGTDGSAPGGGGGGARRGGTTNRNGGVGADGQVIITGNVSVVDLRLTKTVNVPSPTVGQTIIFTLTATNLGSTNAAGVIVTDLLPSGYTYVSDNGGVATTEAYGLVTWTIGNMAAAASSSITITVTVAPPGVYQNTATISGTYTETDFTNNQASVTPTVTYCRAGYVAPTLIKN